jgi:hypothetical protein
MSREYLLKVYFDKPYPKSKIEKFFVKWCGKTQILSITPTLVICEMGCSGGVNPEDTMNSLYNQLLKNKLGITNKETDIIAWSLHPDEAINIGSD